jgi:hypothetical protein
MNEWLTDNFDLIERYFDGKLGKKEKSEFEERLLVEPKLKTQKSDYWLSQNLKLSTTFMQPL